MLTDTENVCLLGKTGSSRRTVKSTLMTHNGLGKGYGKAIRRIAYFDPLWPTLLFIAENPPRDNRVEADLTTSGRYFRK